jgi:hypothetical protein
MAAKCVVDERLEWMVMEGLHALACARTGWCCSLRLDQPCAVQAWLLLWSQLHAAQMAASASFWKQYLYFCYCTD